MTNKLVRTLLLLALIAGITLALVYRDALNPADLEAPVKNAGLLGPVLFILFYAMATVLFLPGSILTLAGGALFGPVLGVLYNLTGATLGAILAFLIARYLAAGWVEQKTGGKLKQLKEGVEAEGWRFVAFVRLVPVFPFNLLNYALGLSRIRLSHYVIASYLCMLPGAIAYTYLGYVGREAVGGSEGLIQKGLIALALLAVVAFLPGLIRRLRQGPTIGISELKRGLDAGEDMLIIDVRSPEEFHGEQGHVAGARNVPLDTLADHLDQLNGWEQQTIILICRSDRRSHQAQQLLTGRGFADVRVAKGGMTAWNAQGLGIQR